MGKLIENDNPYTLQFSFIPPKFIERRSLTSEIISNFTRDVPTYRGIFITGVRGSGKTVVLGDVRNKIGALDDWISIDINPETDLMHSLASKLYRIPEMRALFVEAKLDFSIVGIGIQIEKADMVAYNDDDVVELMLSAMRKHGKKLLITIDEVFYNDDVARFSHALSSYASEDFDIYVLMTGLKENINKIKNKPSLTFLYRAKVFELDILNITAISSDYQKTLGLDVETADKYAFESKGYSLAFQTIGYVIWKALSKYDEYDAIEKKDIYNEVDAILAELAYDKIFEELSAGDVKTLKALAGLIKTNETDTVKVEDVRNSIDMSSETFATYRKRLIDAGIVDGKQYGYLRFRLPRFENYMQIRT